MAEEPEHGVRITGDRVNVRLGPGTEYGVACVADKGDVLEAIDTSGWRAVKLGGVVCWVSEKYSEVI